MKIELGRHFLLKYSKNNELYAFVTQLCIDGLRQKLRCVVAIPRASIKELKQVLLKASNISKTELLEDKSIVLLAAEDIYLDNGRFSSKAMLEKLGVLIEEAIDSGYKGVCGIGEMSWLLGDGEGLEGVTDYEVMINSLESAVNACFVCAYREELFPNELLKYMERVHHEVIEV